MSGRILVVDGVSTNRITMKVRLTSACYEVAIAASGQEALRITRMLSPQIVLIGTSLPDMTASALCKALRELPQSSDLPVLVQASGQDRVAALAAGASGLIEPNGDELTLLARIRGLMRHEAPASDQPATGMEEPAADFAHDSRPRAVFVGDQLSTALGWRHALQQHVGFAIAVAEPERALADAAAGRSADLYLIAADIAQTGDGLRLLSELRARPSSREAAVVIALRPDRAEMTPVALDLGAGDVLPWDLATPHLAPEMAMRLETQIVRKQEADRRRVETVRNMRYAMIDPLTGLHNRRYALPRLAELVQDARETRGNLAVMLLDLDRFKQVNDIHGHPAGDSVLSEVARRMAASLPDGALLARFGGEEFMVALPHCDPRSARRMAEDLRLAVMTQPIALPEGCAQSLLHITVSVGVAVAQADLLGHLACDPETLLASADRALLNAKSSGRNRIVMAPQVVAA